MFNMVQGDPDCEMIEDEIDWARLIKFILLELQAKKPLPLKDEYLKKKGFNLKKRPIHLTLQMLHNFIDTVTEDLKVCAADKEVDKEEEVDKEKSKSKKKNRFLDFVFLTIEEYEKLKKRFPENYNQKIEALNNYAHKIGIKKFKAKYDSHYHTILDWERRNDDNRQGAKGNTQGQSGKASGKPSEADGRFNNLDEKDYHEDAINQ